jgi:uncharacterized protein with HEPN domain
VKKDPRVYMAQILECTERIAKYTAEGKKAFLADRMAQDAVIRNFEIIGEAAKRVPEEYRQGQREIPWRGLTAFRDVLIHQYEGVDLQEVWRVIEKELPALKTAIKRVLPPLDQLEKELAGEAD